MPDKPANATEALRELVETFDAAGRDDDWTKRWMSAWDAARAVLTEPPKDDASLMGHAVTQVLNAAQSLPEHLRRDYFTGLATIAISIMHGTYGREFTAGFLHDATLSLDDPTRLPPSALRYLLNPPRRRK